jgi:hypothetical protein
MIDPMRDEYSGQRISKYKAGPTIYPEGRPHQVYAKVRSRIRAIQPSFPEYAEASVADGTKTRSKVLLRMSHHWTLQDL